MSTNKNQPISVNAVIVNTWLDLIYRAGYTPYIVIAPLLATRPVTGLPDHILTPLLDFKSVPRRGKGSSYVQFNNMRMPVTRLNLSLEACRTVLVSDSTGLLFIDTRFNGVAYPDIRIPVECIVDVYAYENRELCASSMGWNLVNAVCSHVTVDADGVVLHDQLGKMREDEPDDHRQSNPQESITMVEQEPSVTPSDEPEYSGNVVSLAARRRR